MNVNIITSDQKTFVDNLIAEVGLERDWQKRPSLFLKRFDEINIDGDPLVEDHIHSHYRYLPLSIYMLLCINDTVVSDAFFRTHKKRIVKEFIYPTEETYSYVRVFYGVLSSHSSFPSTDNMAGAIFILRDLSFLEDVAREHERGKRKVHSWLQYLYNQIDNYMEEGESREQFHKEIEVELAKADAALALEKKDVVLGMLNTLFVKLFDIDDPLFIDEVKKRFDKKLSRHKRESSV